MHSVSKIKKQTKRASPAVITTISDVSPDDDFSPSHINSISSSEHSFPLPEKGRTIDMLAGLFYQEELAVYNRFPEDGINFELKKTIQHAHWRQKMCEWQYKVIDSVKLSREVVFTSMSFTDRITKAHGCLDESFFRLISVVSLYVAMKLKHQKKVSASTLSKICGGYYSAKKICSMESFLLKTLEWYLHPPTPHSFVILLSTFLPSSIGQKKRTTIIKQACYFCELATLDYFFVQIKPSTISFVCILEGMYGIKQECLDLFLFSLSEFKIISGNPKHFQDASSRLKKIISASC
uniref:Cyclin N-terminal domain-containing protein n=1 Tax=Corethron hystrix TaxID=216773 RepID=A0A7S1G0G6_9STRA|mmetsp:Transcript_41214/g.96651  ORF Transcript_41214/g.96651 Transcript_41214/m.96651 type:complete len:294 (+) Transcript_41214:123-1004(+)